MDQNQLDAALANRKHPSIGKDRINEVIVSEAYHRLSPRMTACVLTLANGFEVIGTSSCVHPDNYDQAIGEKVARDNAAEKVWELEGYLLRERVAIASAALVPPRLDMPAYVGTKCVNAQPMSRQAYVTFRGWELPADENPEDEGYLVEYTDKLDGNVAGFAGYVTWSPADVFERAYART